MWFAHALSACPKGWREKTCQELSVHIPRLVTIIVSLHDQCAAIRCIDRNERKTKTYQLKIGLWKFNSNLKLVYFFPNLSSSTDRSWAKIVLSSIFFLYNTQLSHKKVGESCLCAIDSAQSKIWLKSTPSQRNKTSWCINSGKRKPRIHWRTVSRETWSGKAQRKLNWLARYAAEMVWPGKRDSIAFSNESENFLSRSFRVVTGWCKPGDWIGLSMIFIIHLVSYNP